MNKILLAILLLIILIISILIFKNTEKFSNCDRTKWIDDSCTTGGLCKPPDGDGSEWTCHDPNKNIVILFYTDWCLYSKNFMPIWDKISTQYTTDDEIEFIKINCDPDTSECPDATKSDGSSINCSNGKEIYKAYKISQVPMVLFIPATGNYPTGLRFNLSINGIDSDSDENEQSFDRFIKRNVSNFKVIKTASSAQLGGISNLISNLSIDISNRCPSDTEQINDQARCAAAAQQLKKSVLKDDGMQTSIGDKRPKGCYVHNRILFFNKDPDAHVEADHLQGQRWRRARTVFASTPVCM